MYLWKKKAINLYIKNLKDGTVLEHANLNWSKVKQTNQPK